MLFFLLVLGVGFVAGCKTGHSRPHHWALAVGMGHLVQGHVHHVDEQYRPQVKIYGLGLQVIALKQCLLLLAFVARWIQGFAEEGLEVPSSLQPRYKLMIGNVSGQPLLDFLYCSCGQCIASPIMRMCELRMPLIVALNEFQLSVKGQRSKVSIAVLVRHRCGFLHRRCSLADVSCVAVISRSSGPISWVSLFMEEPARSSEDLPAGTWNCDP